MNPNKEAIASVRESLNKSFSSDELAKAGISTATGLNAYDLVPAAMLQISVLTPLRDKLARVRRNSPGTACHWKVIKSMQGSGIDSMGYVPEGQRAGVKSVNVVDQLSTYTTIGEEGRVTDQAVLAQLPDQDILATDNILTLWKTMQKEENALLAGNRSIKLGTPAAPALTAPTNANSQLAGASYSVAVVALTNEGLRAANLTTGVLQATTITGADGASFTMNGGSSARSSTTTAAVTAGQSLGASVTPIPGAVGYAWYVGTSAAPGAMFLQAISTLASVNLNTLITTGQTASAITADCSYNDGTGTGVNQVAAFDGLMTTALNPANGAYAYAMPQGVAGVGTHLTSGLDGTVVEIDNMIVSMWNSNQVQVEVLYMSANTMRAVSKAATQGATASLIHLDRDSGKPNSGIVAGNRMKGYLSPVGGPYGGDVIDMLIHPNLPDGVILGWASNLPVNYRNNETPAVAQILTRQDYFGIEWPKKTRAVEYGVYTDECLAVYAPFAMGVLYNIAVQ